MPDTKPSDPDITDFTDTANKSLAAGIADETAAYDKAMSPTEGGDSVDESEAQPS